MGKCRVALVAVTALAAVAVALWFSYTPPRSHDSTATATREVVIKRILSSGNTCLLKVRPADLSEGVLPRLESLVVAGGGQEVTIPAHALADLENIHFPHGLQVAEFGDELYLLLAGGTATSAWQAKLTLRDGKLVRREFARGQQKTETAFFYAPTVTVAAASEPLLPGTGEEVTFTEARPVFSSEGVHE